MDIKLSGFNVELKPYGVNAQRPVGGHNPLEAYEIWAKDHGGDGFYRTVQDGHEESFINGLFMGQNTTAPTTEEARASEQATSPQASEDTAAINRHSADAMTAATDRFASHVEALTAAYGTRPTADDDSSELPSDPVLRELEAIHARAGAAVDMRKAKRAAELAKAKVNE